MTRPDSSYRSCNQHKPGNHCYFPWFLSLVCSQNIDIFSYLHYLTNFSYWYYKYMVEYVIKRQKIIMSLWKDTLIMGNVTLVISQSTSTSQRFKTYLSSLVIINIEFRRLSKTLLSGVKIAVGHLDFLEWWLVLINMNNYKPSVEKFNNIFYFYLKTSQNAIFQGPPILKRENWTYEIESSIYIW